MALLCVAALSVSACRDGVVALGGGGPSAPARAGAVSAALGARVTLPQRDALYDTARIRIANAAILPSRVFRDTAIWTSRTDSTRRLAVHGFFADGRYQLNAAANAPLPRQPAESQHIIDLTRLSDDAEYAWDTDVLYALGDLRATEAGSFFRAMLSAAEGRNESAIRADIRSTVPAASAVLGQLFRIDSIRTTHLADNSTVATYGITMTTEGIEGRYPNFAKYMQRYAGTARMQWALSDAAGATYLTVGVREGRLVFRVRTRDGTVIPLSGPARPIPDSLVLTGDFTLQVRFFTAGFRDYRAQFALTRTPREVGFEVVSREEPHWVLPLITERLLRSPLRRPFQGDGAKFRMSVRDSADAQTILLRTLHLDVKESAILRFISRMTSTAYGDFQGKVEREQLAWLKEVFDAFVSDTRRLSG